jgi:aspartyl-tRNA(Asn)/glutamyl-tRNA(Gln) amidotransferase subunit A
MRPAEVIGQNEDVLTLSISELSSRFRSLELSPVEITQACLRQIERIDPKLNAFITVTADSALQQARHAESEIQRGNWRGALHGVPIALKDLIDTAGVRTTAGSELFQDRVPPQDSEVVRRLRAAGAVLLGKTNLHEFAYGASSIVSHFSPVHNPWNLERIAGGSSGGAAAAVAAGLCYAAIGTDTAGSIRLPAAFCGVVGLKPTYGAVSTRGVIPLAWSYDTVGPITRSVEDAALVMQQIAGYDPEDPNSIEPRAEDNRAGLEGEKSRLRVGVPRKFFYEQLDDEVERALAAALKVIESFSAELREVEIPVDEDRTVQTSEAYAFHAKFMEDSSHLYQPETLRRLNGGKACTAADYIEKYRGLQKLRRSAANIFQEVDVLITPTSPVLPPSIEELQAGPDQLRTKELVMLRNTRPFSVLGLPAISVPCGFSRAGLPIGMQIAGPPAGEVALSSVACTYERVREKT